MELRGIGKGMAFIGGAMIVLECVAAWCSSPQTTELNAPARSETLMKYVALGLASGAFMVGVASWLEPQHARQLWAGGIVAGGSIGLGYMHAVRNGLADGGQPTETYAYAA
jgi:hypothetical protein